MGNGKSIAIVSRRRLLGYAVLALALPAAAPAWAKVKTLRGTVSYRERISLPPNAILEVSLLRVSRADASSSVIGVARVRTRNRMPIPYRLAFDDRRLRRGHSYALRARILVDGKVWFGTATPKPVANGPIQPDLRVQRVAARASDPSTPKGKWLAESIRNGGVIDNLQSTIEIAADGKVTGSGGCNGFGGKAAITGDKISFGPLAATRKACPPAIMDQEDKFLAALGDAHRWMVDDRRGKLILFDAGNREILLLARM
ncbi:MAG: YbaY family lipoprotein [Parvibaculaceae bacterium]